MASTRAISNAAAGTALLVLITLLALPALLRDRENETAKEVQTIIPGMFDTAKPAGPLRGSSVGKSAFATSIWRPEREILMELYTKYRSELLEVRELAETFCSGPRTDSWPHTHKCLSTLEEMELLYMAVREEKPAQMMELASAIGYTTLWLVSAMSKNAEEGGVPGKLYSFDVFATPWPFDDPAIAGRFANGKSAALKDAHWVFTLGDVRQTLPAIADAGEGRLWDRILIDAEHTREFGRYYVDDILRPQLERLQDRANALKKPVKMELSVHDVYHSEGDQMITGEGDVVLQWLGQTIPAIETRCFPSFNEMQQPGRHAMIRAVQQTVLKDETRFSGVKQLHLPHGDFTLRCTVYAEPLE